VALKLAWIANAVPVHIENKICLVIPRMFAGNINQQTIISDQPVVVVDGEHILSSFSGVKEATQFLKRVKSETALIFRHNGSNWDMCKIEQNHKSASTT